MPQTDPVILQLRAEVQDYNRKVEGAQRLSAKAFDEMDNRSTRMAAGVSRSFNLAAGAALSYLGAISAIGAAREFLRIADASKQMDAQLRLATQASGNFAQAQEDVRRIASETRTGLEETANLYATFQRNSQELGISQEQAARATETVSKAFQISGATAAEAAGGLRQFLQGLQSGALRGEELNSVLENAPRLAKLLADGLGVTVGQLRALGAEGDLAADKLIAALTNRQFTAGIDAEFNELPVTFDQAMTQVSNAAIETFGAFDRGGGFSQMLANFVSDGADGFGDLSQSATETGIEIRATFEGLYDVFQPMVSAALRAFDGIDVRAQESAASIRSVLQAFDNFANLGTAPSRFVSRKLGFGNPKGQSDLAGQFDNARATFLQGAERSRRERRAVIAEQQRERPQAPVAPRPRPIASGGGGGGSRRSTGPRGPSAETLARRAEQERLAAIREDAAKAREVASLNDDLIAARASIATAAQDILRFELDQIEREKAARIAQLQTEVDLGKLSAAEFNERKGLLEQIAEAKRQRVNMTAADEQAALAARQAALAARDEIATAQAEANVIETRKERAAAERRILDLVYAEEEAAIRSAAARGEIADLEEALANLKRRRSADETGIDQQFRSPLGRYADFARDSDERVAEAAAQRIADLNDTIANAMTDALGIKDPFLSELIKIFLDRNVFGPLAEALDSQQGGGLGGIIGAIGTIFAPGRASGGRVDAGTLYRVNEGASPGRVEGFVPDVGGQIIPLGRMNAARPAAAGGGVVVLRVEEAPGFASRVEVISAQTAVEVQRVAAPQIVNAAASETLRRVNRPTI